MQNRQPPSGGCVLKRVRMGDDSHYLRAATFGWLCVETEVAKSAKWFKFRQPPSGGCVLKQSDTFRLTVKKMAATFGWLCVETIYPRCSRF